VKRPLAYLALVLSLTGCDLLVEIARELAQPTPGGGGSVHPGVGAGPGTSDTPAGQRAREALASCVPGTDPDRQNRGEMKHRALPMSLSGAIGTTVNEMLQWPPPSVVGQPGVRDSDAPIDPREQMLYVTTVDVVLAKMADDDCDIHLEVTAPGAGEDADRVIVELPQGAQYEPMRQGLADLLGRRGRGFGRSTLDPPLRLQIAGYAFFDVHHACSRDRQRGCTHGSARVGSLWELHPVVGLSAQ
jgi:hypothetical protein